jgi:hypothetical protein
VTTVVVARVLPDAVGSAGLRGATPRLRPRPSAVETDDAAKVSGSWDEEEEAAAAAAQVGSLSPSHLVSPLQWATCWGRMWPWTTL